MMDNHWRKPERDLVSRLVVTLVALAIFVAMPLGAGEEPDDGAEPRQQPAAARARLIRVPLPIVGSVDTRVRSMIDQVVDQWPPEAERPILVLEFWPSAEETEGTGSEFERALALARHLAGDRLDRIRTVAYLPRTIRGHAVLPVLACEELIMHPDAKLGDAGADEKNIDPTMRRGYSEIAERRRTIPPAVALGMLDARLKVYKATTAAGARYVLEEELAELESNTAVQELDTLIPVGDMGCFTGSELRLPHGFVSHLVTDQRELAGALGLAVDELELDPSLGGDWRAIRVDLTGPINEQVVSRAQRAIAESLRTDSTNFVCLRLSSPGGSPTASVRLATYLVSLDSSRVRSVAFVDGEARADAAVIALACDHLVVTKDSTLGGPGAHQPSAEEVADLGDAIRDLTRDKSRHWSLPVAMIDPELVVHRYTLAGTDVAEYFCDDELAEQHDPQRWVQGEPQTTPGEPLLIQGDRAEQLGIARYSVENLAELQQLYQLQSALTPVEPSWVDDLVAVLASPEISSLLLFVASFALIAELSSPGMGAGGFVCAVCFVLYFWSQFLNQTADWLEVLLFLTGLGCIAIEIFVIPGFGVFGFGGGLLVVSSLILASQTFILPRNAYQMQQFPYSLGVVLAAGGGVFAGLFVLRRFFDRAPILRRIMLAPPEGDTLAEIQHRESVVDFEHLLGRQGTTMTPVAPSGKARFGKQIVDVISDGEILPRDAKVKVVEVSGNRVLIQPMD